MVENAKSAVFAKTTRWPPSDCWTSPTNLPFQPLFHPRFVRTHLQLDPAAIVDTRDYTSTVALSYTTHLESATDTLPVGGVRGVNDGPGTACAQERQLCGTKAQHVCTVSTSPVSPLADLPLTERCANPIR